MRVNLAFDINISIMDRINITLDELEYFYMSFSGDKYSGMLLNNYIEESKNTPTRPDASFLINMRHDYFYEQNSLSASIYNTFNSDISIQIYFRLRDIRIQQLVLVMLLTDFHLIKGIHYICHISKNIANNQKRK